ncbi:MAG: DUF2029 domain-containing protein [Chloroflexi bacterium]|nr:MAG: DUF2029 domain-containing protein [Chloroflexota bacterium]
MSAIRRVSSRVRRLYRRALLRPLPALLLFGSLTAVSNWLWYGGGPFLARGVGTALMLAFALAAAAVLLALGRGRGQLRAMTLLVVAAVALPAVALIAYRLRSGAPLLMHDGAYQTEEAIRFLLSGRDPYGQDYALTSMRLWHWYVNQPIDPALFHYVYYPLTFLLPLPFALAAAALHLPFDVRLVSVAAIAATAGALLAMPWRWEWRWVALCALFLDPFFFMAQGRNDVLWLGALTLGVLATARGRTLLASLAIGVAFAFKPFAIFFLALQAIALLRTPGRARPALTAAALALLALSALVTITPFWLWNPHAFWADTVAFVAGTDPHSYPMGGWGLAGILLALHLVPNPHASVPLGMVQAAVCLPALAWAGRRVWERPTMPRVLAGGTLVLALFLFCGRFLNDNYLAGLLYLAVLSGAARRGTTSAARIAGATAGAPADRPVAA